MQLRVERTMRNLGADFASGAKCQGRERRIRIVKTRKRGNRLGAVRLAGIQTERFHTVALLSVGCYSADVNGISNSALHQLRLGAARATAGKAAGRNLVLTLATAKHPKYDPAYRANTAPCGSLGVSRMGGRVSDRQPQSGVQRVQIGLWAGMPSRVHQELP